MKKALRYLLLAGASALLALTTLDSVQAESSLADRLSKAVLEYQRQNPGVTLGIEVLALGDQTALFSSSAELPLKPASTMKVITTAAALRELGPEYAFRTAVHAADRAGDRARELVFIGDGDPLLTIENLWLLVRRVARSGVRHIDRIRIDNSRFVESSKRKGQRAYQAAPSVLGFNFSSVAVEVCATAVGKPPRVVVDPPEAGYRVVNRAVTSAGAAATWDVREIGAGGGFEVLGKVPSRSGCRTVYRSVEDTERYFVQVVRHLLRHEGIEVGAGFAVGAGKGRLELLGEQVSPPLREIIGGLNRFSNNVTAEQLFLALGAEHDGRRSRRSAEARVLASITALLGEAPGLVVADGSGLSHDNRLTARALAATLRALESNPRLQPEFEAALPVGGASGTLRDRTFGNQVLVRAKTGSIEGVSALAGYVVSPNGEKYSFALIQNGVASKESANRFEERFLKLFSESR